MLTLHMLVRNGEASIRSRPRVATLNGEQAIIDVSLEEYFTIVTDIGTYLRTELQVVKSGVVLKMTPQIGDDGDITLKVFTEVGDVASRQNTVSGPNGNPGGTLPIIRRRKAETTVRVKQGDAMVIGGLFETQERSEIRRVPLLGSIPLLGALFRKTVNSTTEKEVLIFITPRLLEEGTSPLAERHKFLDVEQERADLRGQTAPESLDKEEEQTSSGDPLVSFLEGKTRSQTAPKPLDETEEQINTPTSYLASNEQTNYSKLPEQRAGANAICYFPDELLAGLTSLLGSLRLLLWNAGP
jgi:type II secretory pathway component GspD/PulD (secretin)